MRSREFIAATPMEEILAFYKLHKETEKAEKDDGDAAGLREGKHPFVKFKKQSDDRKAKLHSASFLRLPLTPVKKWYKKVPGKRSPYIKSMNLGFTGTENKITDVTIKKLHNRTKALELKHFWAGNLNATSKRTEVRQVNNGRVETSFDFEWTNPISVGGVQEALINYACAIHPLWPMDPTALIMLRVLITYKWLVNVYENKRVGIMVSFFQDVTRQNASRAANKEAPLSYDEQEKVLKNLLTVNNFKPEIPLDWGNSGNGGRQPNKQGGNNASGSGRGPRSGREERNKAVLKGKNGTMNVCYGYNDESGARPCSNVLQKGGDHCRSTQGVSFAHVCNVWIPGQNKHCLQRHPRKDHK